MQVNGQYRLTNGYRAPDGTIYVNINSRDPLMVTFGHEMFHDLVADSKYSGMIDTLVENPDYADMVKGMMNAKTELYERNGIELDPDAAAEEVAADIFWAAGICWSTSVQEIRKPPPALKVS